MVLSKILGHYIPQIREFKTLHTYASVFKIFESHKLFFFLVFKTVLLNSSF